MNNEELIAILEDALRADSVVQAINRLKAEAEPDFIEQVDANMIDFLRDALDVTSARIAELEAENQRLKDANRWIPTSERLPETEGMYETTYEYGNGKRQIEKFWFDGKQFFAHYVIAWRELPEPYQGDL
jgi:hypothetical protein